MIVRTPSLALLPDLLAAMDTGFSPNTMDVTRAAIALRKTEIEKDRQGFVDKAIGARDPSVMEGLPSSRLPAVSGWGYWGQQFIGVAQCRWQDGTHELPGHVLGHIGYSIVPAFRGRGFGRLMARWVCAQARERGMDYIVLACLRDNVASARIATSLGGVEQDTLVDARRGPIRFFRYLFDL